MNYLYRILSLVIISLIGWLLIPILFHLMIKFGLINAELAPEGFANAMMEKTVLAWLGSIALAIASIFIQAKWRTALLLCPIILPSIFSVIYTIIQL